MTARALDVIRTECAWCRKVLQDGPPEPVSHGVCDDCCDRLLNATFPVYAPSSLTGGARA